MRRIVPWALFALTCLLVIAHTAILIISGEPLLSADTVSDGFPLVPLGALVGAAVGAVILSQYPGHPIGWLFVGGQLITEFGVAAHAYGVAVLHGDLPGAPAGPVAIWLGLQAGAFTTLALIAILFLLAPDGRLLSPRWQVGIWLTVVGLVVRAAGLARVSTDWVDASGQVPEPQDATTRLLLIAGSMLVAAGVVTGAAALLWRLRSSDGVQRQQLAWVTFAAGLLAFTAVFVILGDLLGIADWLVVVPLMIAYVALPILTGVAILRHHLFEIDLVLNRAIVLAVLGGATTLIYVSLVLIIGGLAPQGIGLSYWASLLIAAGVAIALQPLRNRAKRLADRIVYGSHAAPYIALADFSHALQAIPRTAQLLLQLAETIGQNVDAVSVEIWIDSPVLLDTERTKVVWSRESMREPDRTFPITAGDDTALGGVSIAMPPGRSLRPAETRLVSDFINQLGHALDNQRLSVELRSRASQLAQRTQELEASNQRLNDARSSERDRFETAIRHVVLPHLQDLPASLRWSSHHTEDPAASAHLDRLISQTNEAVSSLRTITRGIFPIQLARRGLAGALQSYLAETSPTAVYAVEEAVRDQRFNPRVESTLYFCVVDLSSALKKVRRVELGQSSEARIQVILIGVASSVPTIDLAVLRDRIAALNGVLQTQSEGDEVRYQLEVPFDSSADTAPFLSEPLRAEG
jgi:hypothetical protein